MSSKKFLSLASALAMLFSGAASAEVITFDFTGTVTYANDPALATAGTPIHGTFSYDDKTKPVNDLKVGFASYRFPPLSFITATVGGHNISTDTLRVDLWNDFGGNVEDFLNIDGGPVHVDDATYQDGSFGLMLASGPGYTKALNNTNLPTSLDLKAFNSSLNSGWLMMDGSQTGTLLQFSIDSVVAHCHSSVCTSH
jgi:hypothetical protein